MLYLSILIWWVLKGGLRKGIMFVNEVLKISKKCLGHHAKMLGVKSHVLIDKNTEMSRTEPRILISREVVTYG